MDNLMFENIGDSVSQGKKSGRFSEVTEGIEAGKTADVDKGYDDNLGNDEDDFNESEDDLMSSQDLEEFAKDDELVLPSSQEKGNKMLAELQPEGAAQVIMEKKGADMEVEHVEGTRRSSRLVTNDEVKIADKATARAMAKDAFINKGMSSNPFSLFNSDNTVLMDIASNLGIEVGSSYADSVSNLDLIKSLEFTRNNLVIQSVKDNHDINPSVDLKTDVDSIIHDDEEFNEVTDLENVMVLRKGRKIHHKRKSAKKKKKNLPPNLGIHLINGGKCSLTPFPPIFQNDRSHLELSGFG
jgi:hypothetical protein